MTKEPTGTDKPVAIIAALLSPPALQQRAAIDAIAANRDALIVAAHNSIHDAHNPVRCAQVVDRINATADLTVADTLAIAAMMLANALARTDRSLRPNTLAGTARMAEAMLQVHDAGHATEGATAGVGLG